MRNPFGSSPKALAALADSTDTLFRYPDGKGAALKAAISQTIDQPVDHITLGNGSDDVIEMLAHAFVSENDHVVFSKHAFEVYKTGFLWHWVLILVKFLHCRKVTKPTGWAMIWSLFLMQSLKKTKLVFIANPNNPTGGVIFARCPLCFPKAGTFANRGANR